MSKINQIQKSSGNVFRDLEIENSDELFIKASLGTKLMSLIMKNEWTQTEAAKILGIKQPEVSRIKNGDFSHYSLERLLGFFKKLDHSVQILIKPVRVGKKSEMLIVS